MDFIFFRPVSLKGELIAWIDGGEFSHCGIVLGEMYGRTWFIEADWDGVKINALKKSLNNYEIVSHLFPSKTLDELAEQAGKPYDYWSIFQVSLKRFFGKPLGMTKDESFICSEFLDWSTGYTLPVEIATPNSIYETIKK